MKSIEMTLAYFVTSDQILLPLKKKKIGIGKYNGVGGRVENNETHEQAMVRECIEEVGLKPSSYDYVAKIIFNRVIDGEVNASIVHIYKCQKWSGKLIETSEMKPFWFDLKNIPYDKMMDNDKYWLPQVLNGEKIEAVFELTEDYQTISYKIENKSEKTM